ncbi:MAG: UTP--glucose-1-phosphate uridylyltransferase, partial [Candidatus Promineofilum sp.]|nr:UTP--glucose-1-phosphate uridylyltransferase [Promineifilum sp.]
MTASRPVLARALGLLTAVLLATACRGTETAATPADRAQSVAGATTALLPTPTLASGQSQGDAPAVAAWTGAWDAAAATGRDLIAQGKVGALLVAGGQGTRLGFDKPKGMFPVGPLSGKTLYQWFAEQLRCRCAEARRSISYFMMTSNATHNETLDFFKENGFFGLVKDDVFMFQQGLLPAIAADS